MLFLQASIFTRQSCCSQSCPTNSARDCYVMHNEACSWPTFHCITYCLMDNYHTPRPTAAFISFRTPNTLDALVTPEQVRFK